MQVYFTGFDYNFLQNFLTVLSEKNEKIWVNEKEFSETVRLKCPKNVIFINNSENISADVDAVVYGSRLDENHDELQTARTLQIPVYSYAQFIYEVAKEKTRVVIGAYESEIKISEMLLHVLKYHNKKVDYILAPKKTGMEKTVHLTAENDFIILEAIPTFPSSFMDFKPNIAMLQGMEARAGVLYSESQMQAFINAMVNGGILVYNAEDELLKTLVEENTNTIRKHPYTIPAHEIQNGQTFLHTPEGEMPLAISGRSQLSNLAGAKWICQHMGIDEDDFYEAISSFS